MSAVIVLISCSDHKNTGGTTAYDRSKSILTMLGDSTRHLVYEKRKEIFDLINKSKIEDRLREGGNRKSSPYNQGFISGRDVFWGSNIREPDQKNDALYMPAYKRYGGRFYSRAGIESLEKSASKNCHTLIVSGLYGLISLEEPIQAYSCHLDDLVIPSIGGAEGLEPRRVSDLWKDLFEQILIEYIEHHQAHGDKIDAIIDLLSEFSYQRLFRWNEDRLASLLKRMRIQRFHRVVTNAREPDFLDLLGQYYQNYIEGDCPQLPPKGSEVLNLGERRLSFHDKLKGPQYIQNKLMKMMGKQVWEQLCASTKDNLTRAEQSFELYDARSSRKLDEKASLIMEFFAALETELQDVFPAIPDEFKIGGKCVTLGSYIKYLDDRIGRRTLPKETKELFLLTRSQLDKINQIRKKAAHKEGMTRSELKQARELIVGIKGVLVQLSAIKKATGSS